MLIAQSTIKPLHSYFPHTWWVRQVLTLAINNVAQKEEATLEFVEDVAGSRRTQPPVDCLWCLVSSFPGLSVNSDNLSFSYVILFLYSLICHYMHETWSWHEYSYALGFLWKNRCDSLQVPEVLIEASANIVVKAESEWVIAVCPRPPCGWGTASPFIGVDG
jgi:hypothetical protein